MIKKGACSRLESDYERSKLCFEHDLNTKAIHSKFNELQGKNPRLQVLIDKFTTDPQRRLKSIFMSTNAKSVHDSKQKQKPRELSSNLNALEFYAKKSTMAGREENKTLQKNINKYSNQRNVILNTKIEAVDKGNKRNGIKHKDFINENKKNAFQLNKIGGFFERRYENEKSASKNRGC